MSDIMTDADDIMASESVIKQFKPSSRELTRRLIVGRIENFITPGVGLLLRLLSINDHEKPRADSQEKQAFQRDEAYTKLAIACFMGHVSLVEYLCEHGALGRQQNHAELLSFAVQHEGPEIAEILLRHGLDTSDSYGIMSEANALEQYDTARLIEAYRDVNFNRAQGTASPAPGA
jgi:hypothetical protein